jgi:hypothetical protein
MKTATKRILIFVLAVAGLFMIGVVAGIIGSIDPDAFKSDAVKFFESLLYVVGFFVALFGIIFMVVIGGHAAISKEPLEKNLSEEMLKKRLKNAAFFTVVLFYAEYRLKKFRDWWHGKS